MVATIYIDNQPYLTAEGQNLLAACLSLGFDLPYFCWHPAMHSVGACRQCAIKQFKDSKDRQGRIVMACMTPVHDGMRISINDPEARAFRASVIEWLMVSHPHDCPVCDEGGECHLQDMTVMTGHTYRRYRFKKQTFRNQDLGPLVNHEMNRCIECYRCVRFYCDFAGGRDFGVFAWHDHVFFGRGASGTLQSEFAGNLVEVCPTGVFTDKSLKEHYTRKWDLQTAPSVCVHCGLGCNTIPGERYGMLRRVRNRYNSAVNGYFLCDRGRYGYEFVNSQQRVRAPMRRGPSGALEEANAEQVLNEVADALKRGKAVGIGSPRATLEANFALRTLVGPERFHTGMSAGQSRMTAEAIRLMRQGPARTPSLREIESADAVLVLGEDVTNTAPMLSFAIRQAARQQALKLADSLKIDRWNTYPVQDLMQRDYSPIFVATPDATKLDDIATAVFRAAPDDIARLGVEVAAQLGSGPHVGGLPEETRTLAGMIAVSLAEAQRPVIIAGAGCGTEAVMRAAGAAAGALCARGKSVGLFLTAVECNSIGAGMMAGQDADSRGVDAAIAEVKAGRADTAIILENDLYRRADAKSVEQLLSAAKTVVVIDHILTPTAAKAHFILPAATFAEATGTLVSNEGRAQRAYQVFEPAGAVRASWRWLAELMLACGDQRGCQWKGLDDVVAAMAAGMPQFAQVARIAPPADYRIRGMKVPRMPHRYSGRTAMTANLDVNEPQTPEDADSPLAFTMEGYEGQPPSSLVREYWAGGWNSVQALNKFQQEVGGPMRDDQPGVRLIAPPAGPVPSTSVKAPPAFINQASQGLWLCVPAHHIFGSEELSPLSGGIASLSPGPYVGLNPDDAARIGAAEGQEVELAVGGAEFRVPVRIRPSLPSGVAAFPVGLKDMPYVGLPAQGRIKRASAGAASARPEGRTA
ncbi:MAG: NADH-quinone oxidoreductase subunit NuoG [Phycisphaerae bacterium]